jgi:Asp/Glu/hydantoin racemase
MNLRNPADASNGLPRTAPAAADRIALIHATPLAVAPIAAALDRLWPAATRMNLLDDSLSADRVRDGQLTPAMIERFVKLAGYARDAGAAAILFTCSAFGPAIERARAEVGLPTLKPNEAMFEQALALGRRIGLVATFESSLAPMRDELVAMGAGRGIDVALTEVFVPHAMADLARGDAMAHHRRVADAVARIEGCDAIALAQFSMADAAPLARARSSAPVLTSPDCAVAALMAALGRP